MLCAQQLHLLAGQLLVMLKNQRPNFLQPGLCSDSCTNCNVLKQIIEGSEQTPGVCLLRTMVHVFSPDILP
jgi:hypothetical protein